MDESVDRWFEFVKDYYEESSVPLSYVLLPNPCTTGFRTAGSPFGMTNLSKRKWNKIVADNNAPIGTCWGGCGEKEK